MPLHSSTLPVRGNPFSSIHLPLCAQGELLAPLSFFAWGIPRGLNHSPTPKCIAREESTKDFPLPGPQSPTLQSLQRRLTHITLEEWLGEIFLPHSLIPHSAPKLPAQGKLHPALLLPESLHPAGSQPHGNIPTACQGMLPAASPPCQGMPGFSRTDIKGTTKKMRWGMGGYPSIAMGATCHSKEDAFSWGCVSAQLSFLLPCNPEALSVL